MGWAADAWNWTKRAGYTVGGGVVEGTLYVRDGVVAGGANLIGAETPDFAKERAEGWSNFGSAVGDKAGKAWDWTSGTAAPWVGNATLHVVAATPIGEVSQLISYGSGGVLNLVGAEDAAAYMNEMGDRWTEAKHTSRDNVAGYSWYAVTNPGEAITDVAQGVTDGGVAIGGILADVGGATINGVYALGADENETWRPLEREHFFTYTASWNKATQFASEIQDDDPNRGYRVFNRVVGEVPGTVAITALSGGTATALYAAGRGGAALAWNSAKAGLARTGQAFSRTATLETAEAGATVSVRTSTTVVTEQTAKTTVVGGAEGTVTSTNTASSSASTATTQTTSTTATAGSSSSTAATVETAKQGTNAAASAGSSTATQTGAQTANSTAAAGSSVAQTGTIETVQRVGLVKDALSIERRGWRPQDLWRSQQNRADDIVAGRSGGAPIEGGMLGRAFQTGGRQVLDTDDFLQYIAQSVTNTPRHVVDSIRSAAGGILSKPSFQLARAEAKLANLESKGITTGARHEAAKDAVDAAQEKLVAAVDKAVTDLNAIGARNGLAPISRDQAMDAVRIAQDPGLVNQFQLGVRGGARFTNPGRSPLIEASIVGVVHTLKNQAIEAEKQAEIGANAEAAGAVVDEMNDAMDQMERELGLEGDEEASAGPLRDCFCEQAASAGGETTTVFNNGADSNAVRVPLEGELIKITLDDNAKAALNFGVIKA